MPFDNMLGSRARWQVLWVARRKSGKLAIVENDFEHDLKAAIELYIKAKRAGKPFATLRCCNVAFPPPAKYMPYSETKKETLRDSRGNPVRRNGKKVKKVVTYDVKPMVTMNLKGITWCPYCMEFRRFQKYEQFRWEGIVVPKERICCPICGISTEAGAVRLYNPEAPQVVRKTRTKGGNKRR
jgi:hypothetical protein